MISIGNNYFDEEMTQKLNNMTPSELKAHVLMERIRPRSHPAWLMVQGQSEYTSCVSEIALLLFFGGGDVTHLTEIILT